MKKPIWVKYWEATGADKYADSQRKYHGNYKPQYDEDE